MLLPTSNPENIVNNNSEENVKRNVHPHEPKVAPPLTILYTACREELVCDTKRAVGAIPGCLGIIQISGTETSGFEVRLHVLAASHPVRRLEHAQFIVSTVDRAPTDARCGNPVDDVGHRRDTIHKFPEARKGHTGQHDTVEDQCKVED